MDSTRNSELLVNVTPTETRVALIENDTVQEVFIERNSCLGIVGNIYKGKVSRVLPGMEAAFIEIGLARTAFLHVSDIVPPPEAVESLAATGEAVPIKSLLRQGQEILVQVIKDPIGTKGARLTTELSLSARYLVYIPEMSGVGVSLKIKKEAERKRLSAQVTALLGDEAGGYIIRTAAEGVDDAALAADKAFLHQAWQEVQAIKKVTSYGALIHQDLPLSIRVLRDLISPSIERIRYDSRETYQKAVKFVNSFMPQHATLLTHYEGKNPIFDLFAVEDDINNALDRRVPLKSGGYLIIDQTEAMTTVDVNTGGFVGVNKLEETIFKTNLEAAEAIARQIRLRNLGGIIILDFIDMLETGHQSQVLETLKTAMIADRTRHHICDVSELGLVEMTRRRVRESLGHTLCEPCPSCTGKGEIKTVETVCFEIFREITRVARQYESSQFLVLASVDVVDRLKDEDATYIAELEQFLGKPIKFQSEGKYGREQFNVVLM